MIVRAFLSSCYCQIFASGVAAQYEAGAIATAFGVMAALSAGCTILACCGSGAGTSCPSCDGQGVVGHSRPVCPVCAGTGRRKERP